MPLESHQCGRGRLVRGVGENNDNDNKNNENNDNENNDNDEDNDNNGNNSNDQHDVAINTTTSIVKQQCWSVESYLLSYYCKHHCQPYHHFQK